MSAPLVSVIVPVHQGERFLAEALDSAFAQDHPAFEVIVVDDGSTDRSAAIAARYPVRLLRRPHRGVAAARNAGLDAARGEIVTVLDCDDIWPVDRLSVQVGHLLDHPELGFVLGLTQFFLTPGEPAPPHWEGQPHDGPVPGHAATLCARASAFATVGRFDESLDRSEDLDWLARAADAGVASATIDHLVLHYRIHANNMSRHRAANRERLFAVLRASVQRKQAAGV